MTSSKKVAENYATRLADLTINSKPLIHVLTVLAMANVDHAGSIVETVEKHLQKVHPDVKLPALHLVDSIVKDVGDVYIHLFAKRISRMFTSTFKQVDETVRLRMFELRKTWNGVFPATVLYHLDVQNKMIDPAWPIYAEIMKTVREPSSRVNRRRLCRGGARPT